MLYTQLTSLKTWKIKREKAKASNGSNVKQNKTVVEVKGDSV